MPLDKRYGLSPSQDAWAEELMGMPMSQWPDEAYEYVRDRRPHCGEDIAYFLAQWVRMHST